MGNYDRIQLIHSLTLQKRDQDLLSEFLLLAASAIHQHRSPLCFQKDPVSLSDIQDCHRKSGLTPGKQDQHSDPPQEQPSFPKSKHHPGSSHDQPKISEEFPSRRYAENSIRIGNLLHSLTQTFIQFQNPMGPAQHQDSNAFPHKTSCHPENSGYQHIGHQRDHNKV